MNGSLASNSKKWAIYSLYGFFFSTTFSLFLEQIFLALALLFVIINVIAERKYERGFHLDFFNLFIFLFLGWSIISAIAGPTPRDSLWILKEEWLFFMIPVAGYLTRDEKIVRTSLKLFAITAVAISLYAIWQHFSGMDLAHHTQLSPAPTTGYRVVGTFSHRLTFGNYYSIASLLLLGIAPYADKRFYKSLFYAGFFLTALANVFTYNRGSLIAMAIGIVIFLIWHGRRHIKLTLALLVALVAVIIITAPDITSRFLSTFETEMEGKYAGSRLAIWRIGWKMALDHPIFGVGQGNFKYEYAKYGDKDTDRIYGHAHNDLINVAAYAGFPGMIFYLGFWIAIVARMVKLLRSIKENNLIRGVVIGALLASVVFFMTSIYEATFADEEIRLFLMAVWGLFLGTSWMVKRGGEPPNI